MSIKVEPGVWKTKMTVDEIKTVMDWKTVLMEVNYKLVIQLEGNLNIEVIVNQDDDAICRYLDQFPRDYKFTVVYGDVALDILI